MFTLEIWGDYACFTRPEFKVERHSYPIITPSAARAIFDSIYLHFDVNTKRPTFRWQVRKIEILNPIKYILLGGNEIKGKAEVSSIKKWMNNPELIQPIYADSFGEEGERTGRTQRQTVALRNVRYRVTAEPILFEVNEKLRSQIEHIFLRRAKSGKCLHQPYLGCRDYECFFDLPDPNIAPVPIDLEIGWMIYDVFDLSRPGRGFDSPSISIFRANINQGVLEVPAYLSEDIRKLGVDKF